MLPTKDLVFHFDESTGTAILIIVDAFLEHAGQYSCKARNSAGETTCTATLTVTAEGKAPFYSKGIQDLTVKYGDTAQFICALENEFFSEFLWAHEGERIEVSEKVKISQNGSVLLLTILNTQLTDQGLYSCTVYNDYGGTTTAAILTVKGGYLTFNNYDLPFAITLSFPTPYSYFLYYQYLIEKALNLSARVSVADAGLYCCVAKNCAPPAGQHCKHIHRRSVWLL
uniref:Ig-like domain-containing protein n=1 Tax=Bubo bubo TaxID=30461 RepID=A0A8C0FF84_BUBBB